MIRATVKNSAQTEDSLQSLEELQQTQASLKPWASLKWRVLSLWGSGAILGPLLDGRHSTHNVLHYEDPTVIHLGSILQLETCWWVPLLFGGAAVILGIGHSLLDSIDGSNKGRSLRQAWESSAQLSENSLTIYPLRDEPTGGYVPSWPFVLVSIALFALQYDLSGLLAEKALVGELPWAAVNIALAATAVAHWGLFDRTSNGLFWAALTAVVGPIVEIGLIQGLHLYHYTHADIFGIPLWIPWVYWCGVPAVGNLGRRICGSIR